MILNYVQKRQEIKAIFWCTISLMFKYYSNSFSSSKFSNLLRDICKNVCLIKTFVTKCRIYWWYSGIEIATISEFIGSIFWVMRTSRVANFQEQNAENMMFSQHSVLGRKILGIIFNNDVNVTALRRQARGDSYRRRPVLSARS